VLVYEATKRIVPEGGIPLNVGVIVLNVETLLNIYNSMNDIPVIEKYITVIGDVENPSTVKVPIGISIREVISLVTNKDLSGHRVINGGPMMGIIVESLNDPVTKTTKGLIVLPKEHPILKTFDKSIDIMLKEARTACMHCSFCTEVCPRNLIGHGLEPDKLMRLASYASTCDEDNRSTTAFLCCDCRLCQYACIMDLQPWKLNKMLKDQFRKNNIINTHSNQPEEANKFREYKKYPVYKLIKQLGLTMYDVEAPIKIENYELNKVKILFKHHIGSPTIPIVKIGQHVKKGEKIGEIEEGKLGTNIHSSINGIIESIDDTGITIIKNI
jgi:Na+-translocating ferredoxin:NAD+ oxidoreductase RnfC subunit